MLSCFVAESQAKLSPIYVFNVGQDNGFVIVSGDERTEQILAYATEGNINPNDIPDNMRAWLRGYEEGIRALDEGAPLPATSVATSPTAAR